MVQQPKYLIYFFLFWFRCESQCRCAVPVPAVLPAHMAAPMGARVQPTAFQSWICHFRKAAGLAVALLIFMGHLSGGAGWRTYLCIQDIFVQCSHCPLGASLPPTATVRSFCGVWLCHRKGIQDNAKLTLITKHLTPEEWQCC